jgi:hypothetical protein
VLRRERRSRFAVQHTPGRNALPDSRERDLTLFDTTTTCLGSVIALVLALASAQSAPAATVTVNAERGADTIDVRASAVLNADAATAWRVLTDYDRYVDFIPDLRVSHVVARRGAMVTVQQSGDATVWLLKMPVHITFEITELPPNRLQSRAVAGSLRALTSCYALTPVPSGIRLDYLGHIVLGFQLFGYIEQAAVTQNIRRQFQALADEIERQGAGVSSHSTPVTGDGAVPESSSCDASSSASIDKHVAKH